MHLFDFYGFSWLEFENIQDLILFNLISTLKKEMQSQKEQTKKKFFSVFSRSVLLQMAFRVQPIATKLSFAAWVSSPGVSFLFSLAGGCKFDMKMHLNCETSGKEVVFTRFQVAIVHLTMTTAGKEEKWNRIDLQWNLIRLAMVKNDDRRQVA